MTNGNSGSLTIQEVYDNLYTQLQHGSTAVLSDQNLPSAELWQLVADTLSTDPEHPLTRLTLFPPSRSGSVTLGPVAGDSLTVSGKVNLLNLDTTTTITVTVDGGEPDLSFALALPAGWTLGDCFWQFKTRDLDLWCGRLSTPSLTWASRAKTKADALVLNADFNYQGIYSIINVLYSGQAVQPVHTPIAFGDNGPVMDARIAVVHSGDGLLTAGPVKINTPYFYARVTYQESLDQEGLMLPYSKVAIGWRLDSQNQSVSNFEISAAFLGETNLFYLTGGYPDRADVLALNDVVDAFFGTTIPAPALPGPLDFLANDVGLENFSLSMTAANPPSLLSATIYMGTDPESSGWVIIGPDSDPLLALREIHFRYSTVNATETLSINSVTLGGTIKISKLLFLAESTYTWASNNQDYTIDANGLLQTADGLPLRFTDLIRGLGAPAVADVFADFFELSFSEIGAEVTYTSSGGETDCYWSAHALADLELRFFGREFLGLHNTYVEVSGRKTGADTTSYAIAASGDIYILGITLPASLVLSETTKTFTVGPLSFTLGDIITWMVHIIHPSWNYELPAPWDILNSIGFENLTIEFDMENQTVSLDTGLKADFGFISLDSVRLTYHKRTAGSNRQGVIFAMKGKFLGMDIEVTTDDPDLEDGEMGWDLVNGKPIEVPGAGDELFKLEYLGVGQHVGFRDTRQLKTIGDVITALENNFQPSADQTNPLAKMNDLVFAENSGWLVGTKFTLIDTVTLSAIFNDPDLYGLRIELGGPKAQSLAGLQFEIMYKRITDTIGLYHIDLRLPDAIRQLEFGEVSVTIPEFVLDIYTNGNFKLDVGFPYNLNFTRSFSVEVFPFVGFGGFYFGYLEGATSDRVPAVSDGTFKPVLEFGFGLSIGVGKTIEKGVLRAGATLTVEGVLEGVLAWFNPDDKDRDTEMFYHIQGTVGIEGHVYGCIDFKIIKASVDVTAGAMVTLAIECYRPIHIQLNVHVSASVKVKILFITIKCSFSLNLNLEFTIGHASAPPWHVVEGGAQAGRMRPSLSAARHTIAPNALTVARTARAARRSLAMEAKPLSLAGVRLTGKNRVSSVEAEDTTTINLQFRPFFTQSNQGSIANNDTTAPAEKARSVAQLFTADATGNGKDTEFAKLANLLFQRVVEARLAQKTAQKDRVSLYDLEVIHLQLLRGLQDPDFSYESLTGFFTDNHIVFSIDTGHQDSPVSGTFFPIIPALTMKDWLTPEGGDRQNIISVDFADDARFMVDQTYEEMVDTYFRVFRVNSESFLEKESRAGGQGGGTGGETTTESMAQYLFRDYFLMVTRSMVDSAVTYLEAYPYTNTAATPVSLEAIASEMSAIGDLHDENPTPLTIGTANQSAEDILDAAEVSGTEITGVYYQADSGETLTDIAETRFNVDIAGLVNCMNVHLGVANAAGQNMINVNVQITLGDITYTTTDSSENLTLVAALFAVTEDAVKNDPGNAGLDFTKPFPTGTEIKVPGARYYTQENDTIDGMAERFQTTTDIIANNNAALDTLITPLSVWAVPPFKHTFSDSDSLLSIAQNYVLSLEQLLNAGYAAAAIVKAGANLAIPCRPDISKTDLYPVMGGTGMTDPVAQSVSRFMLHGLRLPQISPLTFDSMKPVYDNTGQQFDVPSDIMGSSATDYTYELELSCDPMPPWMAFKGSSGTTADYTYTADDRAELQIFNGEYDPASVTVLPMPLMTYVPNRYALRHVIHWQSATGLSPVTGASTGGNGEPNIWLFPDNLLNRLAGPAADHTGTGLGLEPATTLRFNLAVGRREKSDQPPKYTAVENFAYGTMVEIGLKLVKAGTYSNVKVPNAYLVAGTDPDNRDLLYELWTYMSEPGYIDTAGLYLLLPADPASQAGQGVISQNLTAKNTAVLKSNLSTVNTPAEGPGALMETAANDFAASIEKPKEFIKLLWECASVNTGGFYLNYTEDVTGNGLPGHMFDKDGNGTLKLMVIFDSQRRVSGEAAAQQPPMLTLSNCAVLTDHLDLSNAELVVEGSIYVVEEGMSLNDVMTGMGFAAMQDLVDVNRNVKVLLRVGLDINSGSNTVVRPGDSLASVAARVGVTPVTVANEIAADTDALIAGAILQYAEGQMKLFGTGPLGSVGMEVTRPNPDPDDTHYANLSDLDKMNLMFNLLGIDLVSNGFFTSLSMTTPDGTDAGSASEWPPAGPVVPPDGFQSTKDNTWLYRKIVQYFPLATPTYNHVHDVPRLPPAKDNPYAGLGTNSDITFAFNFQDNFGNRTDTSTDLPNLVIPVGYKDHVFSFAAWPGVASSYRIEKAAEQPAGSDFKFKIDIDSGFRVANYVSGNGQTVAQARKRLAADREKFFNIYYQLLQPDMQVSIETSLDIDTATGRPAEYFVSKSSFTDMVNTSLLFFGQLQALPQTTVKASTGDTIRAIDATWLLVDKGAFLHANTTLSIGELFKLSETTPANHLTIPVIVLSQAGQSLTNIASSASAAMGRAVTELQVATANELLPLAQGTAVIAPLTTLPAAGDSSLQDMADTYNTTVTGLATGNATTANILRAGTGIIVQGIEYTITGSDTFSTLADKVMSITIETVTNTLQKAALARGMSVGSLAFANETNNAILAGGGTFTYPDAEGTPVTVESTPTDSLYTIAMKFVVDKGITDITVERLAEENKDITGLLAGNAILKTGLVGITVEDIAVSNAQLPEIFSGSASLGTNAYVIKKEDTLNGIVNDFKKVDSGYTLDRFVSDNKLIGNLFPAGTSMLAGTKDTEVDPAETITDLVAGNGITYSLLGRFNGTVPLNDGYDGEFSIPWRTEPSGIDFSSVQPAEGKSLSDIASLFDAFSDGDLVQANFQMWRTLTPGMTVTYHSVSTQTGGNDTFATLWERLAGTAKPDYAALATAIDNAVGEYRTGALRAGAVLLGPTAKTGVISGKPTDLSANWNVDTEDLLHANRSLSEFLAADTAVTFDMPDGTGTMTATTRPRETINTFFSYVRTQNGLEKLEEITFMDALAQTEGLIAADVPFVVPPAIEKIVLTANRNFPGKIFPVTVAVNMVRVNFRVTTQTIADLQAVPDVTDAQADCLTDMAAAGRNYLDGDEFDMDLRSAFGSQPDIDYLMMLTRRFSSLPTALLDESFKDVKGAWCAGSRYPAHTCPSESDDSLQTLSPFAAAFEEAFDNAVKLGVSAGGSNTDTKPSSRKIWAIDFSASGYGFDIDQDKPSFFARRPITNRLLSGTVPMRIYISGEGTPVEVPPMEVKNANLDLWAKQFFQTMDLMLSPAYAVPLYQQLPETYRTLVGIKEGLAEKTANNLDNLLKSPAEPGVLADAQAAFRDRLMIQLTDAYKIEAVLQFPVTVTNGGPETEGLKPPRLFGQPRNIPYTTQAKEDIDSMATALHVSKSYLVEQIADMPGILNPGPDGDSPITVTYTPTGSTTTPTNEDSLATLAGKLGAEYAQELIDHITVTPSEQGLFAPNLPINVTPVSYKAPENMNIEAVALLLDVSVRQLAEAMQDTRDLFNSEVTSLTWTYGQSGQQATVPVSESSTFNTLAQAFTTAGVTPAPDAAAVANYFRLLPPNLMAEGATFYLVEILPNYDLSNTRAALASENSTLTFFLDVANVAKMKKMYMNLDYVVNQVEHDIRSNAGDPDYEESSWINFIIPFDTAGGNTDTRIGQTEIPIPNENYPNSPILTTQGGINSSLPASGATVMDMKEWDYFYEFEYREAAQDIIYTGININDVSGINGKTLIMTGMAGSSEPHNILDALAQFNANHSELLEDLQQLPFLEPDDTNSTATGAARAFTDFAGQVNDNWGVLPDEPVPAASNQGPEGGAHSFTLITTRDRETDTYLDTLIFIADANGETVWPGKVEVYYNDQWYELTSDTTTPVTETVFSYPRHTVTGDTFLRHRIYFDKLDVIVFQSAGSCLQVKRNEILSSRAMTRDAFIYQTPIIETPDMFTPIIERSDPYLLAPPLYPSDLKGALSKFFKELFDIPDIAWPEGTTRIIKLHVAYRYSLIPGQPLAGSSLTPQAPVILHTQYSFQINPESGHPDYETADGTFVYNVNDVVVKWIQANLDSGQAGYLVFDLVVFEENDDRNPKPVLKLHSLLWDLETGDGVKTGADQSLGKKKK